MKAEIAAHREQREADIDLPMHIAALDCARRAGVNPDLSQWVDLARPLLFGPMVPAVFRLDGPDALLKSAKEISEAAGRLSGITDNSLSLAEASQLAVIGDAAGFSSELAQLVIDAEGRTKPHTRTEPLIGFVSSLFSRWRNVIDPFQASGLAK